MRAAEKQNNGCRRASSVRAGLFAVSAMVAWLTAGCTQSMEDLGGAPSPNLSGGDNDFFKTIAIANMTEIQSSRLALTQSQSSAVKDFAQKMVDDHTQAGMQVQKVAAEKGVMLPTSLDSKHQSMVDDLKSKSGSDFDKAYIDLQVKAHQKTIDADQDEASNGTDPDAKSLASQLLDTLKIHLSMARKLQGDSSGGM